jgi:hypothetical protein
LDEQQPHPARSTGDQQRGARVHRDSFENAERGATIGQQRGSGLSRELIGDRDEPVGRYGDTLGVGAALTSVAHDRAADPMRVDTRPGGADRPGDAVARHVRRLPREPVAALAASQCGVEPQERDRRHVDHDLAGAGNRFGSFA